MFSSQRPGRIWASLSLLSNGHRELSTVPLNGASALSDYPSLRDSLKAPAACWFYRFLFYFFFLVVGLD
jgi:hypothetical protein